MKKQMKMKKTMGLAFCLAACGALAGQGEGVWRLLPVSGGGNMTGVEISPSHPNVWYAYADVGGPYRSDDAGRTWRPLHDGFTAAQRGVNADHVRGLLVDPADPDRIVLVAGWRTDRNPAGAYVSTDGGRSFRRTLKARFAGEGSQSKRFGKALVRHPRDPKRLLAASAGDGIFRSSDGGETVPWRSTETELDCWAYGGTRGGHVRIETRGADGLVPYGGRPLPFEQDLEPGEEVAFKNTYRAVRPSGGEDDIVVTATFAENETGWTATTVDSATAVKVELETVASIPENRTRHIYGVGERVYCRNTPDVPCQWTVASPAEVGESFGVCVLQCPFVMASLDLTVTLDGCSYAPTTSVEKHGFEAVRGTNTVIRLLKRNGE